MVLKILKAKHLFVFIISFQLLCKIKAQDSHSAESYRPSLIQALANSEALLFQQKYKCNNVTKNEFYKITLNKYKEISFISQNCNDKTLENRYLTVINEYDSVITSLTYKVFFEDKIKELNGVKPISISKTDAVKSVFLKECFQKKELPLNVVFKLVFFRYFEDSAYYANLYKEETLATLSYVDSKVIEWYIQTYGLNSACYNELKKILANKYKESVKYEYSLQLYTKANLGMFTKNTKNFDSAFNRLLLKEGIINYTTEIAEALRCKYKLRLSSQQVDFLLRANDSIMKASVDKPFSNPTKLERKAIERVFNEEQFSLYLNLRNESVAQGYTNRIWQEIKSLNVAQQEDSCIYYPLIYNYSFQKFLVNDRYAYDTRMKSRISTELHQNIPKILKDLELAQKAQDTKRRNQSLNNKLNTSW